MNENIQTFIQKVCSNCKNNNCGHGIVVTEYNNMTQVNCCDYIRKDEKDTDEQTKEVMNYYHERNKRYEKMD